MKRMSWRDLAVVLAATSVLVYVIQYLLFHDAHEILIWFLGSLAFLPLQVLLVTIVLERAMEDREKEERLEKMNVVIGAFFSEVGRDLLVSFSDFDPRLSAIKKELVFKQSWTVRDFNALVSRLRAYDYGVEIEKVDLKKLCAFLHDKREFLLRLMENPNLLEHETFTDLLRAVFHVVEELEAREDFSKLPPTDIAHIQADINRSYRLLVAEWLSYMKYLKREYPYLFHLALRQNPFDETADVLVKQ
jgi:hypothetical protein